MRIVTKSNTERDFFIFMRTKKVCRCFGSLSSEQEQFTHGMYMTALIGSLDVKKIEPIMFYEGTNTKVFRRSITFAITLVVTSHSSSFEYTISVHAVHASAERNVCNIVVSIHFKYILASRQDLIHTFVAHLRKRLSLRLWGSWR